MKTWVSAFVLAAVLPLLWSDMTEAQTSGAAAPESVSPSAPVPGKNSFTENRARQRISQAGFLEIGTLTLDSKGIWRASAIKDAKPVMVSLDYQGNVTAR